MNSSISQIAHIWEKTLQKIEGRLNDKLSYDSFFSDSYIYEIKDDNTMVIITNSKLGVTLFSTKYRDLISSAVNDVTETNFNFEFVAKTDIPNKQNNEINVIQKPIYFENAKLNPNLTFDKFVVGDFNREASQAAILIASDPGKMFNPLFIYSGSGLGKTHLLHAIGNHIVQKTNINAKVLYISAIEFVEEYVRFVRGEKENESLKNYISSFDVLLLDDVQQLADKVKTQEMFFSAYQKMINDGKQIVITSDKQPAELNKLEDRLVTRFSQGLTVKIGEPDPSTCVLILKEKMANNNIKADNIDDDVITFFAEKFSKNVRELEGALNRLIFYTISNKKSGKITMEIAIEAAASLLGGKNYSSQLNEQKIINCVAEYYNLSTSQLTGKIRTGQIALARHIAMYLIRETMDIPLKKIGDAFGGKDHTTVMSGISRVEKELKTSEQLQVAIKELRKRIK